MAQGKPYEAAARSLRITSRKLLAQYDAARKRWPPSRCADLVAFGVDTDVQLRSLGQAHERVLLELFLYAAMQARELPKLDAAQAVY
jgi:hypothetical protein